MKRSSSQVRWVGLALMAAGLCGGCSDSAPPMPAEALVVTLATNASPTPLLAATNAALVSGDYGDAFYPAGSRVVLALPSTPPPAGTGATLAKAEASRTPPLKILRELSRGLHSAGGPIISYDGKKVFFSAKATPSSPWQIYEGDLPTGRARPLTAMPGGAMSPALLPGNAIVFSSPVPKAGEVWTTTQPAALHVLKPGQPPRRITYGPKSALDPTVLSDGRILFVSALTSEDPRAPLSLGLFTVNSDGTEVTRFALDRDGPPLVARPREMPGKRVAFLEQHASRLVAAQVSTARPFQSRGAHPRAQGFPLQTVRSIEAWDGEADLLCFNPGHGPPTASLSMGQVGICLMPTQVDQELAPVWLYGGDAATPTAGHDLKSRPMVLEAVSVRRKPAPMGHVSAMSPTKQTGIILCMNANYHREGSTHATAVRVITVKNGAEKVLGEVPLQADGSFIAEVPADTLLGFETLEGGRVVHRQPPSLWVRAGENRSCIGCHEPYNRSPRNLRPQAANLVPAVLSGVKDFSAKSTTMTP